MKRFYILIFMLSLPCMCFAQKSITGNVVNDDHKNDTLLFKKGNVSQAYYQYKDLSAGV